jgi:hypothetical protein
VPSTPESTLLGNEELVTTGADDAAPDNVGGEGPATDWDALAREEDEVDEPPPAQVSPPPPPEQGKQPQVAQTTPAPQTVTPQQPAAVVPPSTPTPEVAPVTQQQAPAQPVSIPEQPKSQADLEAEAQVRTQAYTKSLEDFYKLPEDLATQFEAEPAVALPQLAAKLHMAVEHSLMTRLNQELPQYIALYQQMQQRESEAKTAFYDAHPDLKGYEPQVLQAAEIFRRLNPTATPEQAIQGIGLLVRTSLGIQPSATSAPGGAPAPVQTAAPRSPASAPRPGFTPAMPGGAGFTRAPASGNFFEQMAEEFLAEDLGG